MNLAMLQDSHTPVFRHTHESLVIKAALISPTDAIQITKPVQVRAADAIDYIFSAQGLYERDPVQYKKQTFIGHSFLC